jgi:hypothetical protein
MTSIAALMIDSRFALDLRLREVDLRLIFW